MKTACTPLVGACVALLLLLAAGTAAAESEAPLDAIWVLDLDGAVGPATSDTWSAGWKTLATRKRGLPSFA